MKTVRKESGSAHIIHEKDEIGVGKLRDGRISIAFNVRHNYGDPKNSWRSRDSIIMDANSAAWIARAILTSLGK